MAKRDLRVRLRGLPARKLDFFYIGLVLLDVLLFVSAQFYGHFLWPVVVRGVLYFDFGVILFCLVVFVHELRNRPGTRWAHAKAHWYEAVGLVPLFFFRPLLLLRAVKIGITWYKLGRADQDVSRILTRQLTFKFRDILAETISDAVFLRSLQRVEEVMMRLDYGALARQAIQDHHDRLHEAVHETIRKKPIFAEASRLPLVNSAVRRAGGEVTDVVVEVLESHVIGDIMKQITGSVLREMTERVRALDVERFKERM